METPSELLAKLIAIPSMNPMGRAVSGPGYLETALGNFLEDWLRQLDVEVVRQPVAPGRDNILATYRAPKAQSRLLLEVHQDTVPVEGMVVAPFEPKIEQNRMYGRGACDNKGPMAAMLLALARLSRERPDSASDVTLALTVDEENTFIGASALMGAGLSFDAAVVAEPTSLDIITAHKGVVRWEIETKGVACHSSTPERGINAIYRMAPVVSRLAEYAATLATRNSDPLLGKPTLSVGTIQGGSSVNVVPDQCRIQIDRRLIPGESPDEAYRDANAFLTSGLPSEIELVVHSPWIQLDPMGNDKNESLCQAFGESIRRFHTSHAVRAVPFGTDAAVYSLHGIPSIVFGPGSIEQAHTKDEWVPLDEVATATEIYYDFCVRYH